MVNIQAYMYKEIKSAPHTLYDISCLIAKTSSKKIIHELHELVLLPFTSWQEGRCIRIGKIPSDINF